MTRNVELKSLHLPFDRRYKLQIEGMVGTTTRGTNHRYYMTSKFT